MAAAHVLHYGVGVPVRKVPSVLRALTGVEVSQGAITQDALRRANGAVGDAYRKLRGAVSTSAVVHTDDAGWRVDGKTAFPMAFETDRATVYQVRARHRNHEVREVVPPDYAGVMVTDRARSYDAQALSGVGQQKCLAHVLRSISEVVQIKTGRGRSFGKRLSLLLRQAMDLRRAYHLGETADFAAAAERLRREVSHHLRDRPMADPDSYRLQNQLGWHDDRGNLLRFLDDPSIEPTNNRAARALRGAVIARKVSHCSKNVAGADAFSAFTSVIRTLGSQSWRSPSRRSALPGLRRCPGTLPLLLRPVHILRPANQLPSRLIDVREQVGTNTDALASSVVFLYRLRPANASVDTRQGLVDALRAELPDPLHQVQAGNITHVDMAPGRYMARNGGVHTLYSSSYRWR